MNTVLALRGGLPPRRYGLWLLSGLAVIALLAAAVATTRVPPRPAGRVVLAPPAVPAVLNEADERAAQARIIEALRIMRAHAIAQRLAEADAVLASVQAGADPGAVAAWEARESDASPPLPPIDEAPALLPLPVPLAAIDEPPTALPLAELPPAEPPLPAIEEQPLPGALAELSAPLPNPVPAPAEEVLVAMALPRLLPERASVEPKTPVRVGVGVRVFIHHVARAAEADRLARLLPDGVVLAEIRTVRATPAAPDIRYFFADDRDAAERLAQALSRQTGSRVPARNFLHFRPLPQPGTLEIWLPQP
jgi:hypothetical protein